VKKIIEDRKLLFTVDFEVIYYCYKAWQDDFLELKQKVPELRLVSGPKFDINENESTRKPPTLVVYDDFQSDLARKEWDHLLTFGCSHRNISCVLIQHNLFIKQSRNLSVNAKYFFILRTMRDLLQVKNFGVQLYPQNLSFFMKVYSECTKIKPYSYMFVSCHQEDNPQIRLRSSVWPDDAILYKED